LAEPSEELVAYHLVVEAYLPAFGSSTDVAVFHHCCGILVHLDLLWYAGCNLCCSYLLCGIQLHLLVYGLVGMDDGPFHHCFA